RAGHAWDGMPGPSAAAIRAGLRRALDRMLAEPRAERLAALPGERAVALRQIGLRRLGQRPGPGLVAARVPQRARQPEPGAPVLVTVGIPARLADDQGALE